jgi:hypothetical protein
VTLRRIQARDTSTDADAVRLTAALEQARQRHASAAAQLNVDAAFQLLQADESLSDVTNVWIDAMPPSARIYRAAIPGSAVDLPIRIHVTNRYAQPLRVLAVILIAAIGLAAQRWPRRPSAVAVHWPVVAGVVGGLAWWLWLEPSLLGWAIVGLSLLLAALLQS